MKMGRGGARNRSGPALDPSSQTSERRGIKLTALPADGFTGEVPEWPLPTHPDNSEREAAVWEWAWSTPQAWAWSQPSESWRLMTVAMWVRTFVLCESSEATAADKGSLHRFADQIGLTPAGLKECGWAIATDQVGERRSEPKSPASSPKSARDRLKVASGGN